MYNASAAFHQAVADGEPQIAMLIFYDAVFTNEDIDVTAGLQFNEYFNLEEDIAIGQALSNELSFTLFNDERLLNDYKFGEFIATLGVLINTSTYVQTDGVKIETKYGTWVGTDVYPYVKKNGSAVSSQPSFPVRSIMCYNERVFVFADDGRCDVYDDSTATNVTQFSPRPGAFMKNKVKGWNGRGFFYRDDTRILYIYDSGTKYTYEFVPLGKFIAERPKAPDTIQISMTCNDFMTKFDEDMPSASSLGFSYPVTFKKLLEKICDKVDVDLATTSFINSGAKLNSKPKAFDNATMRDVIKWIAEAAGSNARFNRDGKLVLDWIHSSSVSMSANDYETFDPYWYQTKKVEKLNNRASDGSYEKTKGSGKETYLIQDNPLLKGVS